MLLMGLRPMAVSRACSQRGEGRRYDVVENQGAVSRAEVEIFDLHFDGGGTVGKQAEPRRVLQLAPRMAATSRAMP